MTTDTIISLYQHGALFCAGIVTVYLLLRWGTGHIPWLEEPAHAHYATAFLAALAIVALPASQGTTPNASMLISAAATLLGLLLPGITATKPTPAVAPVSPAAPNGFIHLRLMALLAVVGMFVACGASQRAAEKQLGTCTETAAVKQLEPVVEAVVSVGVDNWKGVMQALAVAFGADEIDCVATFVKELLQHKVGGASSPALQRLDEWLNRGKGAEMLDRHARSETIAACVHMEGRSRYVAPFLCEPNWTPVLYDGGWRCVP